MRNYSDMVLARVDEFTRSKELYLPADYSPENALKSAYLTLVQTKDRNKNPVLQSCTPVSIVNALLDMVVQGLNPAKKQCYFIAFGNQLTLLRSYMGTIAAATRVAGVETANAQVVYEGDEFEYEMNPTTGDITIHRHKQSIGNIDITKIKAAYAVISSRKALPDDITYIEVHVEIMTIDQIRAAWGQGETKGASPAHVKFPEEMAKKTVINRALKRLIGGSTDSSLLSGAYQRTTDNEYLEQEKALSGAPAIDEEHEEQLRQLYGDFRDLPMDDAEQTEATEPEEGQTEGPSEEGEQADA